MRKNKLLALLVAITAVQVSWAQNNPILKNTAPGFLYAADPAAEVFNGKVYVYCSHDQNNATSYTTMKDYVVLESSDMVNWTNRGVVLTPSDYVWPSGQMNAPDVAYKDGWYYFYFPYNRTYIGVAKSQSPTGPWQAAVSGLITAIFDPCVIVDDDGQAYIYGNDSSIEPIGGDTVSHIMGAKLKSNMIELDGDWVQLSSETVNEGVHVFKRNGIYYFSARVGSSTRYWMANTPLPTYATYKGQLAPAAATAPNHNSAIQFNGQWYFFYHRGDVNNGSYYRRSACFEKMYFNADGTIVPIIYTLGTVASVGILTTFNNVGSPALLGSAAHASGTYTIEGGGADIYGAADSFYFASQTHSGNGEIVARVVSIENTNAWAKAGVMFRESSATGAANVLVAVRPDKLVSMQYRTTTGGATISLGTVGNTTDVKWVKLVRDGSVFTGYYSADGDGWTMIGQATVSMVTSVQAGLAVTSHNTASLCTAVFGNVSVSDEPLGYFSNAADIGAPGLAGDMIHGANSYTLDGSGTDIWSTSDKFFFASQTRSGNATIIARVTAVENTNGWAKGGVMFRDSLAQNAKHVMIAMRPDKQLSMFWRNATGGITAFSGAVGDTANAKWIKLVRSGSVFTGYYSTDGVTWTTLSAQTVTMATAAEVGLAVTSHADATLCTATITNVSIQ